MTRIDFYFNAGDKYEVMRKLVVKILQAGKSVFIFTRDAASRKRIDQYLWSTLPLSFIPHVECTHPLASYTPVVIGENLSILLKPEVLLNFDKDLPDGFARFERMLEIVSENADDRILSRDRFRFFKERGYPVFTHDLKADK